MNSKGQTQKVKTQRLLEALEQAKKLAEWAKGNHSLNLFEVVDKTASIAAALEFLVAVQEWEEESNNEELKNEESNGSL